MMMITKCTHPYFILLRAVNYWHTFVYICTKAFYIFYINNIHKYICIRNVINIFKYVLKIVNIHN